MLKFIEDALFASKSFTQLPASESKPGENGQIQNQNAREIPEEHKLNLYMVHYCFIFQLKLCLFNGKLFTVLTKNEYRFLGMLFYVIKNFLYGYFSLV